MRTIRAKFHCFNVLPAVQGYDAKAFLMPVTEDGCEENKSFSNATPAGSLEIYISQDVPAHKFFIPGRDYYIDITKIPIEEK